MSKILIIDDDQDQLDAVRSILEKESFNVDVAQTPEQGIKKDPRRHTPILSSWML